MHYTSELAAWALNAQIEAQQAQDQMETAADLAALRAAYATILADTEVQRLVMEGGWALNIEWHPRVGRLEWLAPDPKGECARTVCAHEKRRDSLTVVASRWSLDGECIRYLQDVDLGGAAQDAAAELATAAASCDIAALLGIPGLSQVEPDGRRGDVYITLPVPLIVLSGLPGAGKTTWANEQLQTGAVLGIVSRDTIREHVLGLTMAPGDQVLGQVGEAVVVSAVEESAVRALLTDGRGAIVDATNLGDTSRWDRVAEEVGAVVFRVDMEVGVEECIRRDAARAAAGGRSVGEEVIRAMAEKGGMIHRQ